MPGGDRTGPRGAGPMSGRGAGYCAGYATPGSGSFGARAGWYRGNPGGGRGWRNWQTGQTGWQQAGGRQDQANPPGQTAGPYTPPVTREQQLEALKNQAEYMATTLADIKRQIETLEAQDRKEST